jgi:hypothetical protein
MYCIFNRIYWKERFGKHKKTAYFSAWDLQCYIYFHRGRNSKTRKECEKAVLDMLIQGEDTEKGFDKLPTWELLEHYQVEIHEHEDKI